MNLNILDTIDPQDLGSRLQRARKQRGLTQLQAAEVINAARTTITAIEKGERRIKEGELVKLAQAYGCQVSDFVRARPEMESFATQFRSVYSNPAEDNVQILRYVEEFEAVCRDYLELEEIAGAVPFQNYPPEQRFVHLSPAQAAEILAEQERSRLGVGAAPIHSLRELLEGEVGLRIFYMEMRPPDEVLAMYTYSDRLGGAIAINRLHPEDQRRFLLAHEYAHFLARRHKAELLIQGGFRRQPEIEQFANRFAASFLMPSLGVTRSYNAIKSSQTSFTLGSLLRLAKYYGVSVEAMAVRLEELKLLPTGTMSIMKSSGFGVREAQKGRELPSSNSYDDLLPKRYQALAVQAYDQANISEGQLARFLRVNRLKAREIAASLKDETSGLLELSAHALSQAGANLGV